jgi:hypothetical protein
LQIFGTEVTKHFQQQPHFRPGEVPHESGTINRQEVAANDGGVPPAEVDTFDRRRALDRRSGRRAGIFPKLFSCAIRAVGVICHVTPSDFDRVAYQAMRSFFLWT